MSVGFVNRSVTRCSPLIETDASRYGINRPSIRECEPDIWVPVALISMGNEAQQRRLTTEPDPEDVVDEPTVGQGELSFRRQVEDLLLEVAHEQVSVTRSHSGAHHCAVGLKIMTVLESEAVEGEDKFSKVDDVRCRRVLLLATIQEDSTGLQPIFVRDVVVQAHHVQCEK